jgi:hypothetical protein
MRLRSLMVAIAVLAVLLGLSIGLRRRAERLTRLSRSYSGAAGQLELRLASPDLDEAIAQAILDRVHWYDAVAHRFERAAAHPWLPDEPDPTKVFCECGHHRKPSPKPVPQSGAPLSNP